MDIYKKNTSIAYRKSNTKAQGYKNKEANCVD